MARRGLRHASIMNFLRRLFIAERPVSGMSLALGVSSFTRAACFICENFSQPMSR